MEHERTPYETAEPQTILVSLVNYLLFLVFSWYLLIIVNIKNCTSLILQALIEPAWTAVPDVLGIKNRVILKLITWIFFCGCSKCLVVLCILEW